ncbi:molecular chaperone [Notoacmeibacter sp. MSK16QG-6]|uniref:TorD/DmsD family molecular chaperone n=1 Tax=Notoacmeibacter sp. MSK16QG-6 TaxID=2957982 RepID=UPI0020A1744D|nr:molecular chaperone TorD family protein [Notoacmeibacter sp. MSK16QG-6]MCP1198683.1 molecular chaperone TorD family protein [Notoacmeibacter sp. MSK16QG-6]
MALPKRNDEELPVEDKLRCLIYALLSDLFLQPPDMKMLQRLRGLSHDESAMGRATGRLARCAGNVTPEQVGDEYDALFGDDGALDPCASAYLKGRTGPSSANCLPALMTRLGIEQRPVAERAPDHAGTLFEMMAGLIEGRFGCDRLAVLEQRRIFNDHVMIWMPFFLRDVGVAKEADFYRAVADLAATFLDIEEAGFQLV